MRDMVLYPGVSFSAVELPPGSRDSVQIADDAVAVVRPPPGSQNRFRYKVFYLIRDLQVLKYTFDKLGTPAQEKEWWGDYINHLRKSRTKAAYIAPLHFGEQELLAQLDESIGRAEDALSGIRVKPGGKQRDRVATASAHVAYWLLLVEPWRQEPTLTKKGPWLRLSSLLYEGATGTYNHDISKYCREHRTAWLTYEEPNP